MLKREKGKWWNLYVTWNKLDPLFPPSTGLGSKYEIIISFNSKICFTNKTNGKDGVSRDIRAKEMKEPLLVNGSSVLKFRAETYSQGEYTCLFENRIGMDQRTFQLTVDFSEDGLVAVIVVLIVIAALLIVVARIFYVRFSVVARLFYSDDHCGKNNNNLFLLDRGLESHRTSPRFWSHCWPATLKGLIVTCR